MNPELWQTRPLLAWASLAPIVLGTVWMWVGFRASERFRAGAAVNTLIATRVLFASLVWGMLEHAGSDQLSVFLPQARLAMEGALPYRDFASGYGPLFAPLLGLFVRAFGDTGPIVLFLAADGVAWWALARALGRGHLAVWIYAAWPAIWYLAVRYAQDEPLAAMALALAWLAGRGGRWASAGVALALGMLITKPLFVLPALAVAFASGSDWRRLAIGFAIPAVAVYATFLALGAPVWLPFVLEGSHFGVGPTLWALPVARWSWDPGVLGWLPLVLLLVIGAVMLLKRRAPAQHHAAWSYGAFAALSPKLMPMYVILWAPLLALWASESRAARVWLIAYGIALPLAAYLQSGPVQGMFGPAWQAVAIAGLVLVPLLSLVPLGLLLRRGESDSDRLTSPRPPS